MSGRNQSQVISLQGRSLLQYRCRFEISQDQSLLESLSQDQDLPWKPGLDLSDFRAQSHQALLDSASHFARSTRPHCYSSSTPTEDARFLRVRRLPQPGLHTQHDAAKQPRERQTIRWSRRLHPPGLLLSQVRRRQQLWSSRATTTKPKTSTSRDSPPGTRDF